MLETLGEIMDWLKFTVAAFGGISLLVGGVGIFTIMTVAVNERKSEIGIMRAIGASQSRIRDVFLLESIFLSIFGAILGLMTGFMVINLALSYIQICQLLLHGSTSFSPYSYLSSLDWLRDSSQQGQPPNWIRLRPSDQTKIYSS